VTYGWIEPGAPLDHRPLEPVFRVSRFWEKPSRPLASDLMHRGCLWNSFIMIGRVGAFFKIIQQAVPDLLVSFESMRPDFRAPGADKASDDLYSGIPAVSFSDSVLAVRPSDLAVLRTSGLEWSDLGEPIRVTSLLRRKGIRTAWEGTVGSTSLRNPDGEAGGSCTAAGETANPGAGDGWMPMASGS
jgi:mannose-1-phosphate guanylyltransferase